MIAPKPEAVALSVPLNALRAFEAAARHLSIKAAAGELGVTPSAVSHQLRLLEEALGSELLRRVGQRLELTEPGRALAPELSAGFGRIVDAVAAVRGQRSAGPLRLSLAPTFAVHWLSPRLGDYPFERPGFALLLSTTQALVDLAAGEADAAVRHGRGEWPGLLACRLFEETLALFGAPGRPDLAAAKLFLSRHREAAFAAWNATLPGGPVRPVAVTIVDSADLALRAAIDGAGVTLAACEVTAGDVAAGRLVPLFDHRVPADAGYYLVYPPALRRDRRLRNLRGWLLEQAARMPVEARLMPA